MPMNYKKLYIITIILYLRIVTRATRLGEQRDRSLYYMPLSVSNTLKFRRSDSKNLPSCNEDQLMMYLAEIQAINPESIINLAAFEEIETLCSKVSDNLKRMNEYLKTCEPPQQKDLYIQLIKGVDSLYDKLCSAGPFQTSFKDHYKCFHDLHNDFQACTGPADWTEDADDAKVCKAFRDISDCYYTKAAKLCGKEAAGVMKELLVAVVDSVLVINCDNVKKNPVVNDAMPDATKAIGTNTIHCSCILLASAFSLFLITD